MRHYLSNAGPLVWPAVLMGCVALVAALWYMLRQGARSLARRWLGVLGVTARAEKR